MAERLYYLCPNVGGSTRFDWIYTFQIHVHTNLYFLHVSLYILYHYNCYISNQNFANVYTSSIIGNYYNALSVETLKKNLKNQH